MTSTNFASLCWKAACLPRGCSFQRVPKLDEQQANEEKPIEEGFKIIIEIDAVSVEKAVHSLQV